MAVLSLYLILRLQWSWAYRSSNQRQHEQPTTKVHEKLKMSLQPSVNERTLIRDSVQRWSISDLMNQSVLLNLCSLAAGDFLFKLNLSSWVHVCFRGNVCVKTHRETTLVQYYIYFLQWILVAIQEVLRIWGGGGEGKSAVTGKFSLFSFQ